MVDILEDETEYLIKVDLPEIKKEEVKVTVENGVLVLSGERKLEKEEKGRKYHRIERAYGSFGRTFSLPDNADAEKVNAEFNEGVLKLHIAKSEAARPKQIEVKISSGYALDSTLSLGVTGGSGRCRRLSANHCFVGEPIFSRRRLLRLFIRVAMAGRFLLSQLHERSSLEIIAGALALFWMSQASFRSGWNGFPRHTSAN